MRHRIARGAFAASLLTIFTGACSGTEGGADGGAAGGEDARAADAAATADADATATHADATATTGGDAALTTGADATTTIHPDAAQSADATTPMDATAAADTGPGDSGAADAGMTARCGTGPSCMAGEQCRHGFCMPMTVPTWDLRVAPADLQRILASPQSEIFVPCTLGANGTTYANGMVRLRGSSSREFPKKSFRIEFPENAMHPGFTRKINLRSEYNDGSYSRNFLSHEMFRRYSRLPVPMTRYINLQVNGAEYGLMLEVERISGSFLDRNGRDRMRNTFEADPPSQLHQQGATTMIPLPDLATYQAAFPKASGTAGDYADLRAFIEMAIWGDHVATGRSETTTTTRIRQAFDVDGFIDQLAVYAVIQSADHTKKNYYLGDQMGHFEYYPWDLDLTFGCLWDIQNDNSICDDLIVDLEPTIGMRGPDTDTTFPTEEFFNELIHLVLGDPQLWQRYTTRICEILASPFWQNDVSELLSAIAETIEPYVNIDNNDRVAGPVQFMTEQEQVRDYRMRRTSFLRDYLRQVGRACPP